MYDGWEARRRRESGNDWAVVRFGALSIYPHGGVARFRVHGEAIPHPDFLDGTIDLVAVENGGRLVRASDTFYSSPAQIIMAGRARHMGEGWETSRRRGDGNDFAVFTLGLHGTVRHIEIDAGYYVGNAPRWVRLSTIDAREHHLDDAGAWHGTLPKRPVVPDTRHHFLAETAIEATHVRLDIYPDGGLSRLRPWGEVLEDTKANARYRWKSTFG